MIYPPVKNSCPPFEDIFLTYLKIIVTKYCVITTSTPQYTKHIYTRCYSLTIIEKRNYYLILITLS